MFGLRRMLGFWCSVREGMYPFRAMCVTFIVVQRRLYRAGRCGQSVLSKSGGHGGEENVLAGKRRSGGYIV